MIKHYLQSKGYQTRKKTKVRQGEQSDSAAEEEISEDDETFDPRAAIAQGMQNESDNVPKADGKEDCAVTYLNNSNDIIEKGCQIDTPDNTLEQGLIFDKPNNADNEGVAIENRDNTLDAGFGIDIDNTGNTLEIIDTGGRNWVR